MTYLEKSRILLMSSAAMKTKPKHKKHHPKPPTQTNPPAPPKNQKDFTLTQGNCGYINTTGITKGGKVVIDFPGCTTVTLFEAFTSPAAQAVWKPYADSTNPLFVNYPQQPNAVGLMIIANAIGQIEDARPYTKGIQFRLSNNPIAAGSQYYLSCVQPGFAHQMQYMNLKSPDISVVIPGYVFGGVATACITNQQKVEALYSNDFTTSAKKGLLK